MRSWRTSANCSRPLLWCPATASRRAETSESAMPSLQFGVHLISRGPGDRRSAPFPSHTVMLEDGIRVEQLGFDAVWLPDHFYFERDGQVETYPEVWTLLTGLALKT